MTGGTGFVGQQVIDCLLQRPVEIIATYRSERPARHGASPVEWVPLDLSDLSADPWGRLGAPDVLIHLAWGGLTNFRSAAHVTEELPLHQGFLSRMIDRGLRHLCVTGTCLEYGKKEGALSEENETVPHLPYAEAKDRLRRWIEHRQRSHDFTLCWMRLFYVWGEGQPQNTLYAQFKQAVSEGKAVFDMSGGEQQRDYLEISDAAGRITSLALRRENIGCVNLCSGKPVKVRALVEGWRREAGSDIHLNLGHYSYPDYEAMSFWGDSAKLDGLLASAAGK